MQIRHIKSIVPATEGLARVAAIAWSPNNQKLAVAGSDKVITLYDETGERKDRFSTKPADPKSSKYYICTLAFSPDSTKLAVAQSDCVVFVYKLGLEWGEKKSICNKLIQTTEITCLTWPREQSNAVVFGMIVGKASQGKFTTHSSVPNTIAWGQHIVAAGTDKCVAFYGQDGRVIQDFDYSRDDDEQEFTVCEMSPSGQTVVVGSFDRLHVYNYSLSKRTWEEAPLKVIENFYTITGLAWKPDGSRLIAGNMCGALEMFDCCLKRTRYKGKFEFTYVSPSQVIVKRLSTVKFDAGSRIVLKSHYGYEIQKVNIFQDQFLIANTPDTLLMGDLASCKLSEIPWSTGGMGNEKFHFDNPNVCMVFNAGELSLVEYGVNEILGSCRTEHMNPHLISVRLNERRPEGVDPNSQPEIKRIAYLIDLQTINILDLVSGLTVASISHDAKIDWLELSGKANKLLFRDQRQQLHLYDLVLQNRTTLLHFCSYVQWVPNSDVVVAQSRNNLCIWYAIESPERVTIFPIKGDVEDIERENGKTEVIVDEGVNTVSYTLDESLIEFGTALDDKDYERAIVLLETLDDTPESFAMWKALSAVALQDEKILVAQRCFAAMGDVAMAKYLAKVDVSEGESAYMVRARLAVLDKQFNLAESIFLEHGKIDECMAMYQEMHKWDKSIKVAELKNHPDLDHMKKNYLQWLIDSGQEDKAGELKEDEGEFLAAINLYLKGGMPARAAFLLNKSNISQVDIIERVASALFKSGLFEKAGELFEKLESYDRALDAYKRGKAFRAAVELCRVMHPQQVVILEEQWGDHLVSQKQMDAAINHYIEAGKSFKAIEAAIAAKQWKKAVGIIDCLDPPESGKPYFMELAKHFDSVGEYTLAEKYYVAARKPQEAVDMYTKANKWEKAHSLATTYMNSEEVAYLYISQAKEMEAHGKLKEAEKLYLTVKEPDLAINMYKNHKHYDQMIRLVTSYHKDLLTETHLYLGKTLETEGNYKQAEHHYVEGKDWKSAVNMYCANNLYEDAYRVAKNHGGSNSTKQVAYLWARSLGGESAVKLLSKFGLLEAAIDFATENAAFDFAFELTMFLEDEGKFKEAESAFILAGKPKEAILMYIHTENWAEALQVAEIYEPASAPEVLISQAKVSFDRKDYNATETLMLRAQRPDLVLKLYKDSDMWKECLQFAKQYLPARVAELHDEYNRILTSRANSSGGKDEILQSIRALEQQKDFSRAIDMYLKFNVPQVTDIDFLEQVWEKAAELAIKFVPERGHEVVTLVCSRLVGIKKYEQAAEFYLSIEMHRDAIDCFARVGLWDRAKEVVTLAPRFGEYLETTYISHLKNQQNADALVNVDATAGLDLFVQRGEWEKCLEKASAVSQDMLNKYLILYAVSLIKEEKYEHAAQTIVKYGVSESSTSLDVYLRLTREILHSGTQAGISAIRELLYKLVSASPNINSQFPKYLLMAHLLTLRNYCSKKRELVYLAAKQSISMLRYIGEIPPDKAFYEAGFYSKLAGINNMAFVCWNRYLDISDAIEEGDASLLENSDFVNTDVPFDVELPTENSNVRFNARNVSNLTNVNRKNSGTAFVIGSFKFRLIKR
ncbi:hypothetical protein HDU82_005043 [Entophlyctis luteolus]|nr:hypothetical protein HDU82_005043 [Entophlyctis luteolus]